MESPKAVYIEWVDINSDGGPWVDLPDTLRPSHCQTIAWLLSQQEDSVNISATVSESQALQTISIPLGCIKRMEFITLETLLEQRK